MKKGVRLAINLSNRMMYTLIALTLILITSVVVYAYGTSNPSFLGHSEGEIEGVIPSGAIMFFDLSSCPNGWSPSEDANGRYVIGRTSGDIGDTVGSALSNLQNKNHAHSEGSHDHNSGTLYTEVYKSGNNIYLGRQTSASSQYDSGQYVTGTGGFNSQRVGNVGTGVGGKTSSTNLGNTGNVKSGDIAPYIQYLICKKD